MTEPTGVKGTGDLVLIVEDNADSREVYEYLLGFSGYQVAVAADGAIAIKQALELLPRLIILDLFLPNVDGWECIRRLKADARTKHIPVIAFSGYASEEDKRRAFALGAADYLVKPMTPDLLLKALRRWLKDNRNY